MFSGNWYCFSSFVWFGEGIIANVSNLFTEVTAAAQYVEFAKYNRLKGLLWLPQANGLGK